MRLTNVLYLVVASVLAGGCASVPMSSEPLDAEGKEFTTAPGHASIYVYRGSGTGTAVIFEVLLDGRIAGFLATNTYLLLSVSPSQHTLIVKSSENAQQHKILAETRKQYFFKVSPSLGMLRATVHSQPVDQEEGRRDVIHTKRAEATTYE